MFAAAGGFLTSSATDGPAPICRFLALAPISDLPSYGLRAQQTGFSKTFFCQVLPLGHPDTLLIVAGWRSAQGRGVQNAAQ
jgi:hypothetical protein